MGHEATDAAYSVFRIRVRGNSLNKIKEAESGRHFFGKKHRMLVEGPYFGGENARRPTDPPALPGTGGQVTRENILRWRAEQGWRNNPPGSGQT